jgi:hypothetical protein
MKFLVGPYHFRIIVVFFAVLFIMMAYSVSVP